MDINLLLRAGMRACGRVLKVLPKDGVDGIGSPFEYMMRVLREETLPSINIIHQLLLRKRISTSDLLPFAENINYNSVNALENRICSDDRYLKFRIPISITDGHDINSIKSCVPVSYAAPGGGMCCNGSYNGMPYGNRWGRTSSADLYAMALSSMVEFADKQLLGSVSRNFRFYFFPPNILAVTQAGTLSIEFCLKHDENLLSVEDTAYEGVKKLFILDLRNSLYNEYGNYIEVSGPNGDYDMKVGDWSSAGAERDELYNLYRSKSHIRHSSMRS